MKVDDVSSGYMLGSRAALLLDRDGVINADRDYVCRREDFQWLPGIFDLARTARRADLLLVVVTNQSGIGRGLYTEDDFLGLTAFMKQQFEAEGVPLAAVYHCAAHPEAPDPRYRHPDHPWRKPRPGMLLAARDDLGLDLSRSIMMGDRRSDLEAGAAAGVGSLVQIGRGEISAEGLPPFVRFDTPGDAARWLAVRSL